MKTDLAKCASDRMNQMQRGRRVGFCISSPATTEGKGSEHIFRSPWSWSSTVDQIAPFRRTTTQTLPRKLLPTRAKGGQSHLREERNLQGVLGGA